LIRPLDLPQTFTVVSDAVFLGVDVESLLGEEGVSSVETIVVVRKGHNFDPTVGSPSIFYMSFRTLFSLE
jgi:hypothetical protein